MSDQEFNFKEILQEILTEAKGDPALMRSCTNYFTLYANLYVRPYIIAGEDKHLYTTNIIYKVPSLGSIFLLSKIF